MTGSLTDAGVEERLRRLNEALPTRDPVLPTGITHLWLVPQYANDPLAALWSIDGGWMTVPIRDVDDVYIREPTHAHVMSEGRQV